MNLIFDKNIQKNSQLNRDTLLSLGKQTINGIPNPNYIGSNVNVIYIYSIVDVDIPYPKNTGKTLYIGEAKRADSTGIRFSQHISYSELQGLNSNVNYTLNIYYWQGHTINLKIYDIGDVTDSERTDYESLLIKCHVKKYGATPIAQGTSGYKVSDINNIDLSISNPISL